MIERIHIMLNNMQIQVYEKKNTDRILHSGCESLLRRPNISSTHAP